MKWEIIKERKKSLFHYYSFLARAIENGNTYELDCGYAQWGYAIFLYENGREQENILYCVMCDFNDYPQKFLKQIMRITKDNIRKNTLRIDRYQKDGFIESSVYWRSKNVHNKKAQLISTSLCSVETS